MDSVRFDAISRALSSRRTALSGVLGGVAALLGIPAAQEADAHNAAARCRRLPEPAKRRACLRRARNHNRTHRCRPRPPAAVCASLGRCRGTAVNNCGRRVTCACPAGKRCLINGSCARTCDGNPTGCPTGCVCTGPEVGGGAHCTPSATADCDLLPQVCVTTADCPQGFFCHSEACTLPGGARENRCMPVCPT
jgi:hypothetical protein